MECFSLRFVILLVLVLVAAASPGSKIAKDGCQDECGGVQIPFPFGIGEGCYFEREWFEIACNKSTNPPIPYMVHALYMAYGDGQLIPEPRLLSINLDDQTFSIASKIAFGCYINPHSDKITNTISYSYPSNVAMALSIPATKNQLFAIGIRTAARMESSPNGSQYKGAGCTANEDGYCEASILSDGADVNSISVSNSDYFPDRESCYYAFIAQVGFYKFATHDLFPSPKDCYEKRVPMVYGWSLRSSFDGLGDYGITTLCGSNAVYFDVDSNYHCRCLQGYKGNPYLQHGCQDINECEDKMLNICEKPEFCVNKNGGYDCLCKHGYHGNGTKSSPCKHDPGPTKLIIDFAICICSIISFIILYVAYKTLRRRKNIQERQKNFKKNGGFLLEQEMRANEGGIDRTKIFTESDLVRATNDFNSTRVLGHEGQGTEWYSLSVYPSS